MTLSQQHVNVVLTSAMKLDKRMKRFFIRQFKLHVMHNGEQYAAARFQKLREAMMAYRADANRTSRLEVYLKTTTWHRTGWLRQLFRYLDTSPEQALNFVKLYCGLAEPAVSVGEAGEAQHRTLQEADSVCDDPPQFLMNWVECFSGSSIWWNKRLYCQWHDQPDSIPGHLTWAKNFIHNHDWQEYLAYYWKWHGILNVKLLSEDGASRAIQANLPRPEMYVDATGVGDHIQSDSLEKDLWNFFAMLDDDSLQAGLSYRSLSFAGSLLDEMTPWYVSDEEILLALKPGEASILDGTYVGHIHHIPKSGTVKRRSIAAPNRVLQMGMAPADAQLALLLKSLGRRGRDCTYNQNRLDAWIGNRVTNPSLYAGSVDLHQATDFLPFKWMEPIWASLFEGKVCDTVQKSWDLFKEVSRGSWENCGYHDHWTKGQPLGALPSFRCLGITHNLILEALAFTRGLGHSPYAVLGDDVVIMNKKLRKEYIVLMTNAGVPLSLAKSYEGNLVQFAGKTFVARQAPFYTIDQGPVTFNNLFDYQWATGIHVPFCSLPKQLRKKIVSACVARGLPSDKAGAVYECAYWYYFVPRGATGYPVSVLDQPWEEMAYAMSTMDEADKSPTTWSGIVNFSGHPVSYLNFAYAEKDGHFLRYRRTMNWYRDKFRPCSTDVLIQAAALAVQSATGK